MKKRIKTPDPNRVRIVFSRKRIVLTLIYLGVSLLLFYIWWLVPREHRYYRQFIMFFAFGTLILSVISFFKLFTREIRMELYRRISSVMMNVTGRMRRVAERVLNALGIKSVTKLRPEDEVRIIISRDDRPARRKSKPIDKKKFSQLDDDRERIRFMYIRFLQWKQKKEKTPVYSYQTPKEIEVTAASNETEHALFDLYTPVRYSPDPKVTPEAVKEQYDYLAGWDKKMVK